MSGPHGAAGDARQEVVREVAARLTAAGVPSPRVDASLLVAHVEERFGDVAGCHGAVLDGLVARRVTREPLQLLLGEVVFRWVAVEVEFDDRALFVEQGGQKLEGRWRGDAEGRSRLGLPGL